MEPEIILRRHAVCPLCGAVVAWAVPTGIAHGLPLCPLLVQNKVVEYLAACAALAQQRRGRART